MRYFVFLFLLASTLAPAQPHAATMEEIARFRSRQVTGVAVSKTGRIFVNFPYWSDDHLLSVAEWIDSKPRAYPDQEWNNPGFTEAPRKRFVCVQSVYVDDADSLWILDPASPKMEGTVPSGPKLVKVDLLTDEVIATYPFNEQIAPKKSYLNDVRIDNAKGAAFITDSGLGAIVTVDLTSGKARRLLDDHPSTKAEPDFRLVVDGRPLIDQGTGKPPQINADGIALDLKNGWLYYHALTGHTLYRIKTDFLLDESLSKAALAAKVETVAVTPAADGMIADSDGTIYLTDLEGNAIKRYDPVAGKLTTVIADKRLEWPDSLSWMPDGTLAVTTSQIQNMPRFNKGKNRQKEPYRIFKITLP